MGQPSPASASTQCGSVIVFKPSVTREQALEALRQIKDVIDLPYYGGDTPEELRSRLVHEFNPEHGGPCWYIP